jgi:hypothetical protein
MPAPSAAGAEAPGEPKLTTAGVAASPEADVAREMKGFTQACSGNEQARATDSEPSQSLLHLH